MSDNSFYITLPSDASMINHPENTGGSYIVDLPNTLHLNTHSWECALVEMIYNRDFPQLLKEDIWMGVCINDIENGTWKKCSMAMLTEKETSIVYEDVDTFINGPFKGLLKKIIKESKLTVKNLQVILDANKHVQIKMDEIKHVSKMPIRIEMSSTLSRILGITQSQLKESHYLQSTRQFTLDSGRSYFPVKLTRAISSLWIYTNIIQSHITGHTTSPLLRVLPLDSNSTNDSTNIVQIQRPYYFRLNQDEIQSIKIEIYNENGRVPIPFGSPVVLKLHIRRKIK